MNQQNTEQNNQAIKHSTHQSSYTQRVVIYMSPVKAFGIGIKIFGSVDDCLIVLSEDLDQLDLQWLNGQICGHASFMSTGIADRSIFADRLLVLLILIENAGGSS